MKTTDGPTSEDFYHGVIIQTWDSYDGSYALSRKSTQSFSKFMGLGTCILIKKKKDCETALRGVHLYLMSDSVVSSRAPTFQGRQDISSSSPATSAPPTRRKPHLLPPILTRLCSHFEQTSSHLNPIHQRVKPPPNPLPTTTTSPIFPQLFLMLFRFTKVPLCTCLESCCQSL